MSAKADVKLNIIGNSKSAENAVDRTTRKTDRLKKKGLEAAKAFAQITSAAVAAGAAFSVKKAADFEEAISDLSAITGATGKDLEFLAKKSREFGAATTLSATKSAEAFKLMASAKPDLLENGAALAAVTREAITLSEAAGIDLTDAAKALGNSLNQFGAEADDAGRFINVLAAGSKFGASSIEEISLAMVNAGGAASTMGLSFEETNAALQVMAANGIKGSEAGTGLRSVLLSLENQSNKTFRPSVVGVSKAFENLNKANLTTQQQMKIFGKLMFNQGNTLVKNADKISVLTGKLTDTTTAYEQAAIKVDNLKGDMKKFDSIVEGVAITLGTRAIPALRDFIKLEAEGLEGLDQFLKVLFKDDTDQMGLAVRLGELNTELEETTKKRDELLKRSDVDTNFTVIGNHLLKLVLLPQRCVTAGSLFAPRSRPSDREYFIFICDKQ